MAAKGNDKERYALKVMDLAAARTHDAVTGNAHLTLGNIINERKVMYIQYILQ